LTADYHALLGDTGLQRLGYDPEASRAVIAGARPSALRRARTRSLASVVAGDFYTTRSPFELLHRFRQSISSRGVGTTVDIVLHRLFSR
jgi:hypothetical protein